MNATHTAPIRDERFTLTSLWGHRKIKHTTDSTSRAAAFQQLGPFSAPSSPWRRTAPYPTQFTRRSAESPAVTPPAASPPPDLEQFAAGRSSARPDEGRLGRQTLGVQDCVHHVGTHDGRDHLHLSAAVGALFWVDSERPLQQLGPEQSSDCSALGGRLSSERVPCRRWAPPRDWRRRRRPVRWHSAQVSARRASDKATPTRTRRDIGHGGCLGAARAHRGAR